MVKLFKIKKTEKILKEVSEKRHITFDGSTNSSLFCRRDVSQKKM